MESTGIYWKSLHAHLELAGIEVWVVNAHHVKHVPGRKTDMNDSQWLAVLARFGLVGSGPAAVDQGCARPPLQSGLFPPCQVFVSISSGK